MASETHPSPFLPPSPSSPPPIPPADMATCDGPVDGAALGSKPGDGDPTPPVADPDRGTQEGICASEADPLVAVDAFADDPDGVSLQEAGSVHSSPAVLSDELRNQIVRQVEYYFSDENLPTDKFLLKFVNKDKEGYVPIAVIASFRRMKRLVKELSLIEAALKTSVQLVVSDNGKKVKRLHPLLAVETTDAKSRTVLVENLPDDGAEKSIQTIFSVHGKVLNVTIHNPHSIKSADNRNSGVIISSKVHALVEFATVEAATSAVNCLNDEKNWRSGMRVELLIKRMGKHGLVPKGRKATSSEKNNSTQIEEPTAIGEKIFTNDHDQLTANEEGQQAKGVRRNRNRGRGRGQVQQNNTGHGHGSAPSASAAQFTSKPLNGPRMPDGTRGFTFGRGMPAISE